MPQTRFVFVDGIIGAGKTTMQQRIADQLIGEGRDVTLIREGDPQLRVGVMQPHAFAPWEDLSVDDFTMLCGQRWRAFARQAVSSPAVSVSDGLLFHGNMTDLFMMGADRPALSRYVESVLDTLRPLQPHLVYLRTSDVRRTLRATCDARGKDWETYQLTWKLASPYARREGLHGFEGLVQLYHAFRDVCDDLVRTATRPTLIVEDGDSWPERERLIFDWLAG
ncbi:MAG: hypothetical protein E6J52_05905 [Chloroflexi bacterium]|nr:MAG: hypothetical protein E6J52_05905 [Chloroflexota bacterium]